MPIVQARAAMICAIAMFLPATVYANEVSLPEIGVTLTGLAGNANNPKVNERPAGYEATLQVGPLTFLSLYRADDPIPSGNVGEATYRSDLLARLDDSKAITAKGAVTLVAGHEAWTIVDVQRVGPLVAYTYKAYLIVDQHPYLLAVSSLGSKRPAEFDATVKVVSSLMARVMCLKLRRPSRYPGGWATARHPNCETEFSGSHRIGCRLGRTSCDSPWSISSSCWGTALTARPRRLPRA